MATILKILHIERKLDKQGKEYYRTHALLSDGTVCIGYGKDFAPKDKVEYFYHIQYDQLKMRKTKVAEE